MAKAYSLDLRGKVFAAWQAGGSSQREVAARFGVSASFVRDLSARHRQSGALAARPRGGGRRAPASPATLEHLRARVAAQPDATIAAHHQGMAAAGFALSAATVGRLLLRLGLTRKKRRSATTRRAANG